MHIQDLGEVLAIKTLPMTSNLFAKFHSTSLSNTDTSDDDFSMSSLLR